MRESGPRALLTLLFMVAAIVPSTARAITLTNGALTVEIRSDNGAIDSVVFGGANFYKQGTFVSDWGMQNGTSTATFALNTTDGLTGIPATVTTPSGTVQVAGTYTGGGANVTFTRTYSLVPGLNVLRIATQFLNAGSAVTVSYFDTFDPDQGMPSLGFATYNDVLGNVARASATSDLTVVMGSEDAGVTLAAGSPFRIDSGTALNSFFAAPFDGNGALADQGMHVGLRFPLAAAESRTFTYDQAYGTSTTDALDAYNDAIASCGNGDIEGGEECDDGGVTPGDGCDAACQIESGYDCTGAPSVCAEVCGDGLIVGAEGCDDGGVTAGDGCDATCQIETGYDCTGAPSVCSATCGDGLIVGAEGCDDGGVTPGDGCDATCEIEAGYDCTGTPSVCSEICGDGLVVGGEGCDDAGTTPGDGCDGSCQQEAGWSCTGSPSICTEVCGDGIITPSEGCDDGDATAGDGCDASCQVECRCTCSGEPSICTCSQLLPIVPKKLIVLDQLALTGRAKTAFLARDSAITKGTGTDLADISVEFTAAYADSPTSGTFVVPAGDAGWLAHNDTAKFVNKAAPAGSTQTRVNIIKPGTLIKLVGKGLGDTPLDIIAGGGPRELHTAYCVTNGGEEICHCSTFLTCDYTPIAGGTVAKVRCKAGQGDASCAAICQ